MSMEDRVAQFHIDAQQPRSAKTAKEIEKLRKFLFKNQEYRFTEREQSHLFSAVQSHFAAHQDLPPDQADNNPALLLLDDALKMPFTVFTTSHKKTFLKWHAKLTGGVAPTNGGGTGTGAAAAVQTYQVYDMTDDTISCMTDDGDTVEVDAAGCEAALVARVRELFDGGADVRVTLHDKRSLASIMNT